MAAHLPPDVVHATFGDDLGERPENERWFRELLGLAEHSPFECVGSPPEARLALALAIGLPAAVALGACRREEHRPLKLGAGADLPVVEKVAR